MTQGHCKVYFSQYYEDWRAVRGVVGGGEVSLTDRPELHGNTLTGALGNTTSTRHLHSLLQNTHFVLLLIRGYHF